MVTNAEVSGHDVYLDNEWLHCNSVSKSNPGSTDCIQSWHLFLELRQILLVLETEIFIELIIRRDSCFS